jgi:hypothetical protein
METPPGILLLKNSTSEFRKTRSCKFCYKLHFLNLSESIIRDLFYHNTGKTKSVSVKWKRDTEEVKLRHSNSFNVRPAKSSKANGLPDVPEHSHSVSIHELKNSADTNIKNGLEILLTTPQITISAASDAIDDLKINSINSATSPNCSSENFSNNGNTAPSNNGNSNSDVS